MSVQAAEARGTIPVPRGWVLLQRWSVWHGAGGGFKREDVVISTVNP